MFFMIFTELFPNKKLRLDNNESNEKSDNSASKDDCATQIKDDMDTTKNDDNTDDCKNQGKEEKTVTQASDSKPIKQEDNEKAVDIEKENATKDGEEAKIEDPKKMESESGKVGSTNEDTTTRIEAIKSPAKVKKYVNREEPPSTSVAAAAAAAAAAVAAANPQALTITCLTPKNANKKTAEDRLLEEHEKRIKLLLTMETYIKSILALMQKDESNSPNATNTSTQPIMDDTMESEQNTTPVPESSDEGGNNTSQFSVFNISQTKQQDAQKKELHEHSVCNDTDTDNVLSSSTSQTAKDTTALESSADSEKCNEKINVAAIADSDKYCNEERHVVRLIDAGEYFDDNDNDDNDDDSHVVVLKSDSDNVLLTSPTSKANSDDIITTTSSTTSTTAATTTNIASTSTAANTPQI